jgi:uracil-DNA glycosylase
MPATPLPNWSDWLSDLAPAWRNVLLPALTTRQGMALHDFLSREATQGGFYPAAENVFAAFRLTPLDQVRVVILGQDPYHGAGQAHGLAFSVPDGVKLPPSLRNIYKELGDASSTRGGNLTHWARQGVLLLNTVLTVRPEQAASHQGQGWEAITDAAISSVNAHQEGCIFMLWGAHAQKKKALIDQGRHHILEAPHPSPLSAHRGFLGCGHFSTCAQILKNKKNQQIQWTSV